jgi:hypothetical protein
MARLVQLLYRLGREEKGKGHVTTTSCRELSKEKWEPGLHGAEEKVPKTLSATDELLVRFRLTTHVSAIAAA